MNNEKTGMLIAQIRKENGTFVNPAHYLGLPENIFDETDVSAIIKGD